MTMPPLIGSILIITMSLGLVTACSGAEEHATPAGATAVDSIDMATLKSQTSAILAEFDELDQRKPESNRQLALDNLAAVRTSIEGLLTYTTAPTVPQTTPAPPQQMRPVEVQPGGPVRASSEPPTAEEIDEMERGLALTHRPGPPLEEVEHETSVSERVFQAATTALEFLDDAKLAIEERRFDDARAAQAKARQAIRELDESM